MKIWCQSVPQILNNMLNLKCQFLYLLQIASLACIGSLLLHRYILLWYKNLNFLKKKIGMRLKLSNASLNNQGYFFEITK